MGRSQEEKYGIAVDDTDTHCLTLQGKEYWLGEDGCVSEFKSMSEIIITAANYYAVNRKGAYHFTDMDRVLYVEPHMEAK